MKWNDGKERAMFKMEQTKLREEYLKQGMTEEQISAMYEYDLKVYRGRRVEAIHTQVLDFAAIEGDDADEGQNPLYEKFADKLSVNANFSDDSRYGWTESIDNPNLASAIDKLPAKDLELLTQLVSDGLSQTEIAANFGVKKAAISRKISRLKIFLKKFS